MTYKMESPERETGWETTARALSKWETHFQLEEQFLGTTELSGVVERWKGLAYWYCSSKTVRDWVINKG